MWSNVDVVGAPQQKISVKESKIYQKKMVINCQITTKSNTQDFLNRSVSHILMRISENI
jgi:hypothetical protein